MRQTFMLGMSLFLVPLFSLLGSTHAVSQPLTSAALSQIAALISDKRNRTPDEQKLDSNLLFAMRALAPRLAPSALPMPPYVANSIVENVGADNLVAVTIRAKVTEDLLTALSRVGAQDIAAFPLFDTVTARLAISELLNVAAHADVRFIRPLERPLSNASMVSSESTASVSTQPSIPTIKVGSVTSQGVVAHGVDKALSSGIDGTGQTVCVISDGVNSAAARQATGDIPTFKYLPGQLGSGDGGTAMLEIVHDMAPGAALGFATGNGGEAQMATNILNLQTVLGCRFIVDDVTYYTESAFQDGPIAQALNSATDIGQSMYFSSAGNSGNVSHGTSGTWEGDWVDSGVTIDEGGVQVHLQLFGGNPFNVLTSSNSKYISLKWSDPIGGSNNDYELFLFDSTGKVLLHSSVNSQAGSQDPFEGFPCTPANCPAGAHLVVAKYSGQARALRIDTTHGALSVNTAGSTFGHNAASAAITVAAVDVANAVGGPFTGNAATTVEKSSSDGPRKMFYRSDGAPITSGNFLFGTNGGTTVPKVDIAAADGVRTAEPPGSLNPFFGTSAAVAHAAAIAALVGSANNAKTTLGIENAMFASALDIEEPGRDRDSGVGIVMAPAALRAVLTPIVVSKSFSPEGTHSGGTSTLTITLINQNSTALHNVAFVDTYPSQVINATSPNTGTYGAGCGGTLSATPGGNTFAMTNGVVPPITTCKFFVTVTSNATGVHEDSTGAVTTPIALNSPAASASLYITSAPTITSANHTTFTAGSFGTFLVTTTGYPPPYVGPGASSLPTGITLVNNSNGTGTLSGTTALAGTYPFTIYAANTVPPDTSQVFTLTVSATAPGAPTGATATAGNTQATVTFAAPASSGGSPITSYTATSSSGSRTGTCFAPCSSIVVSGLTNGNSYTFTVVATNSAGNSSPSSPSNAVVPAEPPPSIVTEPFDVVAGSPPCVVGWSCQNLSAHLGSTGWFQGDNMVFSAQAGAGNSYIGADLNNTSGATISNWLISPQVSFHPGATLSFYTRTARFASKADRLEVRISTNGASTYAGATETSVGDFTTLLLVVNPNLIINGFNGIGCPPVATSGYPEAWCLITLTSAQGIPTSGSGRIAFRYFVTDGGPNGNNSNYIGIDTFSFFAPALAPTLQGATSRKVHGAAGTFDRPLAP